MLNFEQWSEKKHAAFNNTQDVCVFRSATFGNVLLLDGEPPQAMLSRLLDISLLVLLLQL